ncbi:hypothetical protein CP969_27525 [Streptomyces viridosporus T7A]|uniref:Uncharacterized protein n=1 Tax=Streptomyces viridosporus T7A TaxID=665577 RepID=A0ABX6AM48_STRVD|nr:hypothetical protein CP969_27525 [Streptomyces viridosporus T7A]
MNDWAPSLCGPRLVGGLRARRFPERLRAERRLPTPLNVITTVPAATVPGGFRYRLRSHRRVDKGRTAQDNDGSIDRDGRQAHHHGSRREDR